MPVVDRASSGTCPVFPAYIPPPPRPQVSSSVHYVADGTKHGKPGPVCRAALVTEVDEADPYLVGVCAFSPTGLHGVPLAAGGAVANFVDHEDTGSWHWPTPTEPDTLPPRDRAPQ